MATTDKPNILVIWGDDIGQSNLSCYTHGLMGYRTPNIDRIAKEGMLFTDSYGEQSCTAGRSSFITGQSVYRTGLSKVGIPAAPVGMSEKIVTIAALLKEQGYATGQFGKNHLGDLNHMLPTNHGFDEFFGNLYHLNAEEQPEMDSYPSMKDFPKFHEAFDPRGVIHSWATDKADPYEFADITSNTYWEWWLENGHFIFVAQAAAAKFAETFKEFPAIQKPNTFTIDDAMTKMSEAAAGAG